MAVPKDIHWGKGKSFNYRYVTLCISGPSQFSGCVSTLSTQYSCLPHRSIFRSQGNQFYALLLTYGLLIPANIHLVQLCPRTLKQECKLINVIWGPQTANYQMFKCYETNISHHQGNWAMDLDDLNIFIPYFSYFWEHWCLEGKRMRFVISGWIWPLSGLCARKRLVHFVCRALSVLSIGEGLRCLPAPTPPQPPASFLRSHLPGWRDTSPGGIAELVATQEGHREVR